MRLRTRILTGALGFIALAIGVLAIALSYESACGAATPPPKGMPRMKAIVHRCYGPAQTLAFEDVEKPTIGERDVLIKVHAAGVNPHDWHMMLGKPYIMRLGLGLGAPHDMRLGVDFSGTVEAVGKDVTRFKPGDEVFGGYGGSFAEYISAHEDASFVHKPANLSFEQAGAMGIAATTALQGLRDHGRLQRGQKVLINGASGGVGTFAVQIAKAYGAHVTGVCSTRNLELVRALGADEVIDYTRENLVDREERYDLIIDNVGNHALSDLRKVLKPNGTVVMIGGPKRGRWIGPLSRIVKGMLAAPFVDEKFVFFMAQLNQDDLNVLADLARAGKLTVAIDRSYRLDEVAAAMDYLGTRHARGKVVLRIDPAVGLDEQPLSSAN